MRHPEISAENDYSAWDEAASEEEAALEAPPALELRVESEVRGERLDKWLAGQLTQYSRSRIKLWIDAGFVLVNGEVASPKRGLWRGDSIRATPQLSDEDTAFVGEAIDLDIVYEDDAILVINKPAGLVVHPAAGNWSGTLLNGLLHYLPALGAVPRAGIVHRLDKETSGLLVVAKTMVAQTHLVRQLASRTMRREYLALVWGDAPAVGTVDRPMGRHPKERTRMAVLGPESQTAKPAVTHFETIVRGVYEHTKPLPVTLLRCRLETGRTHQIRVHLQSISLPIVGDPVYGRPGAPKSLGRQALHALRLGLIHPASGSAMVWSAQAPTDFVAVLAQCDIDSGRAMADPGV